MDRTGQTRAPQTALELDRVPGISQCAAMSEPIQPIARRTLQHSDTHTEQNRLRAKHQPVIRAWAAREAVCSELRCPDENAVVIAAV